MLSELCRELHNWFAVKKIVREYNIEGGNIDADFLHEGQYFRIVGSIFNEGVYKYPATELKDETFYGAVWAMAVPDEVVQLSDDIDAYLNKYADIVQSPYTSESFGGYSYSKQTGASASSGAGSWKTAFADRLSRWRKLP